MKTALASLLVAVFVFLGIFHGSVSHCKAESRLLVVPVGRVVTKEVCNGVPVGNEVFTAMCGLYIVTGNVYKTNTGFWVIITGTTSQKENIQYTNYLTFTLAPAALPAPAYGTKGQYFATLDGVVIYANYL